MNSLPPKMTSTEGLCSIVSQIAGDPFYSKIIESAVFQRLKHISFLGAINYTHPCLKQKGIEKSRYTHSLSVAGLAKYISNKRGYDREVEKHIVTAALLHDIGHGPLSHSIEPVFKEKWGVGHHQIGRELILGKQSIGKNISSFLKNTIDLELVLNLIDGKSSEPFVDLFSSPINIDTIDGITRCYGHIRKERNHHYDLLEIAEASFINTKKNKEKILDDFWKLKDTIYRIFILSRSGLMSDTVCQEYFRENIHLFNKCDWFDNEKIWKKKYSPLFKKLRNSKKMSTVDFFRNNKILTIHRRKYKINTCVTIDNSSSMKNRYICEKYKKYCTSSTFYEKNR